MTPERWARLHQVLDRRQPDLTVLLENVHKPRNFHAIVRTADAVGVMQAFAVTPLGPLRRHSFVAAGSDRWVGIETFGATREGAAAVREQGFRIVAAHPTDRARDFREVDYTQPTALLLGQEKFGLTEEGEAAADELVKIPMLGMVSSLNVSVAAALILFEAQRQRQEAGLYNQPRIDEATRRRLLFEWAYPELADYCRRRGRVYPALTAEGELAESVR